MCTDVKPDRCGGQTPYYRFTAYRIATAPDRNSFRSLPAPVCAECLLYLPSGRIVDQLPAIIRSGIRAHPSRLRRVPPPPPAILLVVACFL